MYKLFITTLLLFSTTILSAQKLNEMPNFIKYEKANVELIENISKGEIQNPKVVFIGNSITQGWAEKCPDFFKDNNFVGRGISGQTSPQLLLRFRKDVVELNPDVVVINIGTNDIAENTGDYNPSFTLDNIKSMAEIAENNGIKVILSAVLPVEKYKWRPEVKDSSQKIDALNKEIKAYADSKGFEYIDYNTPMRNAKGGMICDYATDGVHPTLEGYAIMMSLALEKIKEVLK